MKKNKNIAKLNELYREAKKMRIDTLRNLVAAVRDVSRRRQMNAAEPPATQDAWDRLQLAVRESERILVNPLDKKKK